MFRWPQSGHRMIEEAREKEVHSKGSEAVSFIPLFTPRSRHQTLHRCSYASTEGSVWAFEVVSLPGGLRKPPDLDECMPGVEKTYLFSNEADVVRAASRHLVDPINMLLPVHDTCGSEATHNNSRLDMRWTGCWSRQNLDECCVPLICMWSSVGASSSSPLLICFSLVTAN